MCGRYMLTTPVDALRQLFLFTERPNLAPAERIEVCPEKHDAPLGRQQPQHGAAQCRLAAAALADDAQGLAGAHLYCHPVHGLNVTDGALEQPTLDRKPHTKVLGRGDDGRGLPRGRRRAGFRARRLRALQVLATLGGKQPLPALCLVLGSETG